MNPLPFNECSEEEQTMREFAADCAREELEEMGFDEDFIECTIEEILDGHTVEIYSG